MQRYCDCHEYNMGFPVLNKLLSKLKDTLHLKKGSKWPQNALENGLWEKSGTWNYSVKLYFKDRRERKRVGLHDDSDKS